MKKINTLRRTQGNAVPVFLFLLFFGIHTTLHAAYYVANTGLDSPPGTSTGCPFRTIQKAANTIMTNISSVTSYIMYGTYREKVLIRTNRNRKYMVFSKHTTSPIMNGAYASNFAFKITNAGNVTISGLTIARYSNGIVLKGIATNNRILASTIFSNRLYGIFINSESGDRNLIQGNDIWGQYHPQFMVHSYGICISNGDNNTISSNQYRGNKTAGVYLNGTAMGNNIINNLFFAANGTGIYITDADGNTIRTNQIFRNSTGIYCDGSAVGNYIIKNSIYSNDSNGIDFRASNNYILSNNIWGFNQDFGILFTSVANNNIRFNKIHHNQFYGIRITGSTYFNTIGQNSIYSNDLFGIRTIDLYSDNNYIVSNNFYGLNQNYGIYITAGADHRIYYNLFNRCQTNIYLTRATNTKIFNNTIFGAQDDGLLANNSIITLYNNIFLSNGNGAGDYGVQRTGGGIVYLGYNNFYGISTRFTNGGCIWGTPNIISNPLLDMTTFTISSASSPAIDTGKSIPGVNDNFQGDAPDLGCKESSFSLGPFYVDDNTGSDFYNGTFNTPFQTIQRAANRLAHARNITSSTCYIYPGNYPEKVLIASNKNPGFMVFTQYSNIAPAPLMNGALVPASNYAIKITNASRVIISGLTIKHYQYGIFFRGMATNNQILGSTFYSNYNGIFIQSDDADNNLIQGNIVRNNINNGINLSIGDNNIIRLNQINYHNQSGIFLAGSATGNLISKNSLYSNFNGIVINDNTANNNYILTNNIWGSPSSQRGIGIWDGNNNSIQSNRIHHFAGWGIFLASTACSNYITKNLIYSNNIAGIQIGPSANNNLILTNIIWAQGQDYGIKMMSGTNNNIFRNLFKNSQINAIRLTNSKNIKIFNNTIFKTGDDGVLVNNSTVTLYNNIILSNGYGSSTDYGVYKTNGGTVYLGNNNFHGNWDGPTNGGCIWGNGNSTGDPLLDTASLFAITSVNSVAVDGGRPIQGITEGFQGTAPDMGWIESPFSSGGGPFYVDVNNGDDYYTGTFATPFKTIHRGVNRMASGVNVTSATCYIFPGNYAEKVTIASNKNPGYMVLTCLTNTNTKLPVMNGSGVTNFAIRLTNVSRVIISGLKIKRFSSGIKLVGVTTNNQILNSMIYSNTGYGINNYSPNSDKNYFKGNDIWRNQNSGIYMWQGDNNIIISNQIHRNTTYGINFFNTATLNYVMNNSIHSNGTGINDAGINISSDTVDNNYIIANSIRGPNQSYGIYITAGDRNTIKLNQIYRLSARGIYLLSSACSNYIAKNSIYSNSDDGIYINSDTADNNYIFTNNFWGHFDDPGVRIEAGNYNLIQSNQFHHNQQYGIIIGGTACTNYFINNSIYSNNDYGLWVYSSLANNNHISLNTIWGINQNSGLKMENGHENWIYRNIFNRNQTNISIANTTNTRIFNNTIFGALDTGVLANNSIATLYNNIILSNGDASGDYGVQQTGVGTVYLDYNNLNGNFAGPTNGNIIWGIHNKTLPPLIDTTSTFEILLRSSPCVDSGKVIPGITDNAINQPDMGWKEFFYDDTPPWSTASKESGFYSEPFDVIIEGKDNESPNNITIYYTLDNSDPTSSPTTKNGVSRVTININATTTLKFYAINNVGLPEASINTRQYDFIKIPSTDVAVYNNHLDLSQGEAARIIFGKAGNAEIKIYNVRGVLVKSFAKKFYTRGESLLWNGTIENSTSKVGAGLYIVMITGDINMSLKMIVKK